MWWDGKNVGRMIILIGLLRYGIKIYGIMTFSKMRYKEVKACAEVAAKAFHPYDYFTLFFDDAKERMDYLRTIIASEYRANRHAAHLLVMEDEGKIVAVAQLHGPDYKKPSDLKYLLSGFTKIYRTADKQTIDDWLEMDKNAGEPCHRQLPEAWYLSSLVVDPQYQGKHYGTRMIEEGIIPYIQGRQGNKLSLFTNSEKNCRFYEKLGFRQFDSKEIEYHGKTMGSWSYMKEWGAKT